MPSLYAILAFALSSSSIWAAPLEAVDQEHPSRTVKRGISAVQSSAPQTCPSPNTSNLPCANGGVMVLVARGSDPNHPTPTVTDPQYCDLGSNLTHVVNQAKSAGGHGSFVTAVPYPASTAGYGVSLQSGINAATDMIQNYVNQCGNDSKIVVVGYSQGAQIMSSVLVGYNITGTVENGIDSEGLAGNIVAGVLFADPSHIWPAPIDRGSGHHSGRVPIRFKTTQQEQALSNVYGNVLRSYCHAMDEFCAAGNDTDSHDIHLQEVGYYKRAAVQFLVPLIKQATGS